MHAQMEKILFSKFTRLNPYFGWFVLPIFIPAKVGIKFCRFARECVSFVHAWTAGIVLTDTNSTMLPVGAIMQGFYKFYLTYGISSCM